MANSGDGQVLRSACRVDTTDVGQRRSLETDRCLERARRGVRGGVEVDAEVVQGPEDLRVAAEQAHHQQRQQAHRNCEERDECDHHQLRTRTPALLPNVWGRTVAMRTHRYTQMPTRSANGTAFHG